MGRGGGGGREGGKERRVRKKRRRDGAASKFELGGKISHPRAFGRRDETRTRTWRKTCVTGSRVCTEICTSRTREKFIDIRSCKRDTFASSSKKDW